MIVLADRFGGVGTAVQASSPYLHKQLSFIMQHMAHPSYGKGSERPVSPKFEGCKPRRDVGDGELVQGYSLLKIARYIVYRSENRRSHKCHRQKDSQNHSAVAQEEVCIQAESIDDTFLSRRPYRSEPREDTIGWFLRALLLRNQMSARGAVKM